MRLERKFFSIQSVRFESFCIFAPKFRHIDERDTWHKMVELPFDSAFLELLHWDCRFHAHPSLLFL